MTNNTIIFVCDICFAELPDEFTRLERHTEWHTKARVQGRNTAQGMPEYTRKEIKIWLVQ